MGSWGSASAKSYILLYQLSRIGTYGLLGVLVGFVGQGLGMQSWQQELSLISGLLLLFAFLAFYLLKLDTRLMRLLFPYLSRARALLQDNKKLTGVYFMGSGILNGLMPCGMLYLALFPAMGSGHWWLSTLYMVLFGLGTLPLLLLTNLTGIRFFQHHSSFFRKAVPVFIIATAVLLILRGMDLGIPYLSPQLIQKALTGEGCN
jgi:sulfite exporter TauE/SafE